MNNAPDIEIYVANINSTTAQTWLESVFAEVSIMPNKKGMPKNATSFKLSWQGNQFTAMVVEQVVKGYTSVWLDCSALPWQNDSECARDAAVFFNKGVRVTAGGWDDSADADAWIDISPNGELKHLIWKTS